MQRSDALNYHSLRAARELDLGLTAASIAAARAHLQLASMHMQKARELNTSTVPPPLAAVA